MLDEREDNGPLDQIDHTQPKVNLLDLANELNNSPPRPKKMSQVRVVKPKIEEDESFDQICDDEIASALHQSNTQGDQSVHQMNSAGKADCLKMQKNKQNYQQSKSS